MIVLLFYHIDRIIGYNIGGINASGQVNLNRAGIGLQILNVLIGRSLLSEIMVSLIGILQKRRIQGNHFETGRI